MRFVSFITSFELIRRVFFFDGTNHALVSDVIDIDEKQGLSGL